MRAGLLIAGALALLTASNAGAASASWKVEKLPGVYQFTEGPVRTPWGTLLCSDTPSDKIWEIGKQTKVYRGPIGKPNGLAFDKQGRLLICQAGERKIARVEKDGSVVIVADTYEGKRLNSPNDLVVKSDGTIYFTDPTYGVDAAHQELTFKGVYRIKPNGKPEPLVKDFDMPNGLCFSRDEKKLYVADSSDRRHIRVFKVAKDGTLSGGEVFATLPSDGVPDGMKIGPNDELYTSGPRGIWIYAPSGKLIGMIPIPETPANLAWGDKDCRTLYVTARTSVYRVTRQ